MIRRTLLATLILGAVVGVPTASAQTCYGDNTYQSCTGRGGYLNCTGDMSFYSTCRGSADGQTFRGTTSTDPFGNLTFNGTMENGTTFRCTSNDLWSTCR